MAATRADFEDRITAAQQLTELSQNFQFRRRGVATNTPFPLDGDGVVGTGFERFLYRYWLTGTPARERVQVSDNWVFYRGHYIRTATLGRFAAQDATALMLAIDILAANRQKLAAYTWKGRPIGEDTADIIEAGPIAWIYDRFGEFTDESHTATHIAQNSGDWSTLANRYGPWMASRVQAFIALHPENFGNSRGVSEQAALTATCDLDDQAEERTRGWTVGRINVCFARAIMDAWNPRRSPSPLLATLIRRGGAPSPLLGSSAVFMSLIETVCHEVLHAGFRRAGFVRNGGTGSRCRFQDALEFASRWPGQRFRYGTTPHAWIHVIAGEMSEICVYGKPYGWSYAELCCSGGTALKRAYEAAGGTCS